MATLADEAANGGRDRRARRLTRFVSLHERAAVSAALLCGLALRLHRLGEANVWWDEALAIWAVRDTIAGVTHWTATDVHPPVFFWQLWGWVRLVGESEFASRAVVAFTGVALIAVAYALGRRAGGAAAGVLSAVLVAGSPLLVWWSMELRMYTTAAFFIAAAAWCALAWAGRARGRAVLAGYACAAWAALHTVYLAAAPIAVIAFATLLVMRRDRPGAGSFVAANAAVAALTAPWLVYAVPKMSSWSSITEPAGIGFVARLWATLLASGQTTNIDGAGVEIDVFWIAVGLAATVAMGGHRARRGRAPANGTASRPGTLLLGLFVAVPPVIVWAITQPRSIFYAPAVEARYFVPFAGPSLCFIAATLRSAWKAMPTVALLAALPVLVVPWTALPGLFSGRHWSDAPSAMAAAIWTQARHDDVVVLVSGDRYPMFRHAYDRRPPPGTRPYAGGQDLPHRLLTDGPPAPAALSAPLRRPEVIEMPEPGGGALADYNWEPRMRRLLETHGRIWLVELESHLQDPDGLLEKWLADRAPLVLSEAYGTDSLHLFAHDGKPPVLESPLGEGARWLSGPARAVLPGDPVNLVVGAVEHPGAVELVEAAPDGLRTARAVFVAAGADAPGLDAAGVQGSAPPRRFRAVLDVSPRVPAGTYDVLIRGEPAPIAALEVRGSPPRLPLSRTHIELSAPSASGGAVQLRAIAWSTGVRAGEQMVVDLVWAAATGGRSPDAAPTAFVHLLGPARPDGGTVWSGHDATPSGGWPPAPDGVFDRHLLDLPPDMLPGTYTLEVGLYDANSLERYGVAAGPAVGAPRVDREAARVIVDDVVVRPRTTLGGWRSPW